MINFIDCFTETPVNNCVNHFTQMTSIPSCYHMPSIYGMNSLQEQKKISKIIILGSASHITENLSWHKELANFIDTKLKGNIPVLGICFGHQLMGSYYGCEVDYIDKRKEVRSEARKLKFIDTAFGHKAGDLVELAYAHGQIISKLSKNFKVLANSQEFQNEIIQHNDLPLISLQGHPEASHSFLQNDAKITDKLQVSNIQKNGLEILTYFCENF